MHVVLSHFIPLLTNPSQLVAGESIDKIVLISGNDFLSIKMVLYPNKNSILGRIEFVNGAMGSPS